MLLPVQPPKSCELDVAYKKMKDIAWLNSSNLFRNPIWFLNENEFLRNSTFPNFSEGKDK